MKLTKQQVELIEKYLRDDLSESEGLLFKEQLNDENFKAQLMDHAQIIHSIEKGEDALLRKRLKSLDTSGKNIKTQGKDKKAGVVKWIFIAVIVSLILAVFFFFNQGKKVDLKSNSLYANYHQAYPVDELQRGDNDIIDPNYNNAMLMYAEENYEGCLVALDKVVPADDKVKMYQAACLIESEKHNEAIPILKELENARDLTIKQASEWYQALSYLKLNNEKVMSSYIDRILSEPAHPFFVKAKRLKADVKE